MLPLYRVLLLTGSFDVTGLIELMATLNPALQIDWLRTETELAEAVSGPTRDTRMISFCSDIIVPAKILGWLGSPAYNIHPGPPTLPGHHPESWGAYLGVTQFGATLHVMEPRVDEGAIIDTISFEVPPGAGQRDLSGRAFNAAIELLMRWLPSLVSNNDPLRPSGQVWQGQKWRDADRDAVTTISPDIDPQELDRRRRAFAELAPGCLKIRIGGLDFVYSPTPEA